MEFQAEISMPYASVWKRLVASLIDSFIVLGIFLGVMFLGLAESPVALVIAVICMIIGPWVYYAWRESSSGTTIGKKIMGIKVVGMFGESISFGRASGRYFGKFLSGILCIGYIMAFFTEKRQALHDMLAGTVVIDASFVPVIEEPSNPEADASEPIPLEALDLTPKQPIDPALESFGAHQSRGLQGETQPPPNQPLKNDVEKVVPAGMKECTSCGNLVGLYQTKCHKCGAKLKAGR